MTTAFRIVIGGLFASALLSLPANAQSECVGEYAAQKRDLVSGFATAGKTARRLTARLDAQEMRIGKLSGKTGVELIPPAPELPDIAPLQSDEVAGCTEPMDAEASRLEGLTRDLETFGAALQSREAVIAQIEVGELPARPVETSPATTSQAPEGVQAEEPETAVAQPMPADETPADAPAIETVETVEAGEAESSDKTTAKEPSAPAQPLLTPTFTPLALEDAPDLFQRVIALPGMMLRPEPGEGEDVQALPVFSVLYVFERRDIAGVSWLQVGGSLTDGPQGWVSSERVLDWSTMLVMQFAPRGKRNPVLFFDNDGSLVDMISGPFYQTESTALYQSLIDERAKIADDPAHEAQWPTQLIAVEPETAVRFDDRPYLLPILDWRSEMFDGTVDTTLVKVAAVPSALSSRIGTRDEASMTASATAAALEDDEFRVGVVFAIDTTISMRPFIERTYQAIRGFYDAFSRYETSQYVSFGLVGFRDTLESNGDALEYVTRVFQPLDPEVPVASVLSNMEQMREARASSLGFAEDSIAGLVDAIDQNDWSPYDARLVILVTDASARTDARSKYPDMSLERLREKARSQNITLVPIHLQTPANSKGDAEVARAQYRVLSQTGDLSDEKYIPLDATTDEAFARELTAMAEKIAAQIMVANAGMVVREPDEMEPVPEPLPATAAPRAPSEGRLAEIVGNDIFRAQLESLGRVEGSAAPAFLAGWASDRDLSNPEVETLEVSVYLTRNQLSTLDKRLSEIIGAFREGGSDPQTFFANLQFLAAQTTTDPDSLRQGDRAAIEAILPGFLKKLPYRSQVLRLDQSYWASMSVAQQQEFIEALESRRRIYSDLFGQTEIWADFGAGDPGLEATPVRLVNLP
ncbi:hypothetical protein PVT71_24755 (plasmid) [Salipiger sp. H15]|uniref:VWFA domain-containing protein n=1 Tax=Alloyangia sp. H15 TaxID=3029062 RepID=A0AAU8ARY1_9RHOB